MLEDDQSREEDKIDLEEEKLDLVVDNLFDQREFSKSSLVNESKIEIFANEQFKQESKTPLSLYSRRELLKNKHLQANALNILRPVVHKNSDIVELES